MSDLPSYDFAIIGGGIAGAGVAAMLGQKARVLLLEKEDRPGYHSTGRSAAIFIQNYGSPEIRALNKASYPFLNSPPADFAEAGFLSPRGMMLIAGEDGEKALNEEIMQGEGLVRLSSREAAEIVPLLRAQNIKLAAYEKDAQDIDVAALHQAFLRQAGRAGAAIQTEAELQQAQQQENELWHLKTSAGDFMARVVVNAAGAWADQIAELCGVEPVGITPLRRSMAVLPSPSDYDLDAWPLVADVMEHWYMKPDAGRLLVSPSDEIPVEPHDAFVDDLVLAEGLYAFEQATGYPVTRVENQWAGLRCFSPDRNPVVGFDTDNPTFFWLAGQGGYGIQTAPALSELAADLIQKRGMKNWMTQDLISGLSPDRFRET